MTQEAIAVDKKRNALQKLWSQVFEELIQTAVIEMWDNQAYMKMCMDDIEKIS